MMINKYGLKMTGLKKASGSTVNWTNGGYTEIFYNLKSGEVWTVDQVSVGYNSWTVYDDTNIIKICNTCKHMTMQEIADGIRDYAC